MYSRNAIRLYSLLISIVITLCMRQCGIKIQKLTNNVKEHIVIQELSKAETVDNNQNTKIETENISQETEEIKDETHGMQSDKEIWQLMIPKIDLIAPIEEGTNQNTIKKSIGHFERNKFVGRKYRTCSS